LESKIKEHKLEKNVKFYNKYLSLSEIIKYLQATDIYISSSENPNQITSGTLAYAVGCGRVAVSTPFLHAKDLFEDYPELLVEFKNPKSFENAIIRLLEDNDLKRKIEKDMYHKTRFMTWPNVALAYNKMFKRHLGIADHPEMKKLPKINTSHLLRMTDNFGIIQFANQTSPDIESGYTLDDNARAMLVCNMYYEKFKEFKQLRLIKTYLDYIKYVQDDDGKLYNYVNEKKTVDYEKWSEDAHGRALWALGYLISSSAIPEDFRREAENIFLKALKAAENIKSPRSASFIINGLYYYSNYKKSKNILNNINRFGGLLVGLYKNNAHPGWTWYEPYLAYANSKLPEALLYAYELTNNKEYLKIAKESLDFLVSKTFKKGMFIPIGQRGWYFKGDQRAYHDQQPIDAAYTLQTLLVAYKVIKEEKYKDLAFNSFLWFLGKNSLNQVIYNEKTGGCYDGVGETTININQGAESTLSYLLARLSLQSL
jgi:hypothetical protein